MKIELSVIAAAACALLMAIPLAAGNTPAANNKSTVKTASNPGAWPAETLSGQIVMVDPARKLVVVKTPDGVPFDMDVSAKTRIMAGNRSVALKDLTQDVSKQVSVKFVPERRGDMARTIQIGG